MIIKYDSTGNVAKVSCYNVGNKFGTTVNELSSISEYVYSNNTTTATEKTTTAKTTEKKSSASKKADTSKKDNKEEESLPIEPAYFDDDAK